MKDIAKFLGITPPSATSLVNHLLKSGLVRRQADVTDRRLIRVVLTKKGEKLLLSRRTDIEGRFRSRLEKLAVIDQKRFADILEKIVSDEAD